MTLFLAVRRLTAAERSARAEAQPEHVKRLDPSLGMTVVMAVRRLTAAERAQDPLLRADDNEKRILRSCLPQDDTSHLNARETCSPGRRRSATGLPSRVAARRARRAAGSRLQLRGEPPPGWGRPVRSLAHLSAMERGASNHAQMVGHIDVDSEPRDLRMEVDRVTAR